MIEFSIGVLFAATVFFFVGYMIGNTFGYSKGIGDAADIWENSFKLMADAMAKALKDDKKAPPQEKDDE